MKKLFLFALFFSWVFSTSAEASWITFADLTGGPQPLTLIDNQFGYVAAMGQEQCSASGSNTIVLTPMADQPTISAYNNYQLFGFVASATSTAAVTINVNGVGALPAYLSDGATQIGSGGIVGGVYYIFVYNSALNSGGGGFQVVGESPNLDSTGGFLNKMFNSSFDIAGSSTSGSVATTITANILPGWNLTPTGATINWYQDQPGITLSSGSITGHSLQLNGNTGMTQTSIYERIVSSDASPLSAQQVTIQFSVLNATGSTITPTLLVKHATAIDNWTSATTDVNNVSLQPISNNMVGTESYTFAASSNTYNGLQVQVNFGAALNSSSNIVYLSGFDIRATPGVASGLNGAPPPIEVRQRAIEQVLSSKAPTQHYFTSGTSQTYTVPTGVSYIQVYAWGGGGGGGGSGGTGATNGTNGGNTTFGSLTTGYGTYGGPAGGNADSEAPSGGWDKCTQDESGAGNGQIAAAPGGFGGCALGGGITPGGVPDSTGGGAGGGAKAIGWPAQSGTGCGGGGAASITTTNAASGGAGGPYCEVLIANPAATYTYTVGSAGVGGSAGPSGWAGGNGDGGGIRIIEHYVP
jgi:hypothetical protein